jgi:hypothetical protein
MYREPGRYARGQMDPGDQTTGTRDEHYDLISILYHALHGAENCKIYAADAVAAGRDEFAAFFREAQAMHAVLAERAKGHLGIGGTTPGDITQEGPVSGAGVGRGVLASGGAPGDVALDAPAGGEGAAPPTGEPRRAVPPDAPRTQDPPPRTGDAPPSPSEQLRPEEERPSEEQPPR